MSLDYDKVKKIAHADNAANVTDYSGQQEGEKNTEHTGLLWKCSKFNGLLNFERDRERRIIYSDRRRRSFVVTETNTAFI